MALTPMIPRKRYLTKLAFYIPWLRWWRPFYLQLSFHQKSICFHPSLLLSGMCKEYISTNMLIVNSKCQHTTTYNVSRRHDSFPMVWDYENLPESNHKAPNQFQIINGSILRCNNIVITIYLILINNVRQGVMTYIQFNQ